MFSDFMKAIAQLNDPATRRVVRQALAGTVLFFLALWIGASFALSAAGAAILDWARSSGWNDFLITIIEIAYGAAALSGMMATSFLLFPATVALALSFLLDRVAAAVEQRHYPDLPPAREQSLLEMSKDALRLGAITVTINLLALPLYLVLLLFPPLNLMVFYAVNGYLLGREYFELAAVRRLESAAAQRMRKRHAGRIFLAGVIVAILLTLPVVNLVMPIVAVAFMLHLFERLRRQQGVSAGV